MLCLILMMIILIQNCPPRLQEVWVCSTSCWTSLLCFCVWIPIAFQTFWYVLSGFGFFFFNLHWSAVITILCLLGHRSPYSPDLLVGEWGNFIYIQFSSSLVTSPDFFHHKHPFLELFSFFFGYQDLRLYCRAFHLLKWEVYKISQSLDYEKNKYLFCCWEFARQSMFWMSPI